MSKFDEDEFVFNNVRGHVEVYLNGVFMFSADTMAEARNKIDDLRCMLSEEGYILGA